MIGTANASTTFVGEVGRTGTFHGNGIGAYR